MLFVTVNIMPINQSTNHYFIVRPNVEQSGQLSLPHNTKNTEKIELKHKTD